MDAIVDRGEVMRVNKDETTGRHRRAQREAQRKVGGDGGTCCSIRLKCELQSGRGVVFRGRCRKRRD